MRTFFGVRAGLHPHVWNCVRRLQDLRKAILLQGIHEPRPDRTGKGLRCKVWKTLANAGVTLNVGLVGYVNLAPTGAAIRALYRARYLRACLSALPLRYSSGSCPPYRCAT